MLPMAGAVQPLLTALADSDQAVRGAAIAALGTQRDSSAVLPLIACLDDPSPFIAQLACNALEQIGKPAVPQLIAALSETSAAMRRFAARALARIKDPSAIAALFKALDDESMYVQYWADEGLEALGVGQVYFKP